MMSYEVIERACNECSITFNPELMICKDCEPARFNFCLKNRKNRFLNEGVNT